LLKRSNFELSKLEDVVIDANALTSIDASTQNPVPVIYQSGYLTIKDYDAEFRLYHLGYPNKEVEDGVVEFLNKDHR
ncbi:MAG: hypothetical protein LBM05_02550, partial [Endomicrobium sp.]|nr:hypothetical protein [Endomicrobium sp.]